MDINVLATKIKVKLDHTSILHPRGLHSLRRRAKVFSHLQGCKRQVWDPGTQISPWFWSLLDSLPVSSTHTKGLPHFLHLCKCSHDRGVGTSSASWGMRMEVFSTPLDLTQFPKQCLQVLVQQGLAVMIWELCLIPAFPMVGPIQDFF